MPSAEHLILGYNYSTWVRTQSWHFLPLSVKALSFLQVVVGLNMTRRALGCPHLCPGQETATRCPCLHVQRQHDPQWWTALGKLRQGASWAETEKRLLAHGSHVPHHLRCSLRQSAPRASVAGAGTAYVLAGQAQESGGRESWVGCSLLMSFWAWQARHDHPYGRRQVHNEGCQEVPRV